MNRPLVFGGVAVLVAAAAVGLVVVNQPETPDQQSPEPVVAGSTPVGTDTPVAEDTPVAAAPPSEAVVIVTPETADAALERAQADAETVPQEAPEAAVAAPADAAEATNTGNAVDAAAAPADATSDTDDETTTLLRRPAEEISGTVEPLPKADDLEEAAEAADPGTAVDAAAALADAASDTVDETTTLLRRPTDEISGSVEASPEADDLEEAATEVIAALPRVADEAVDGTAIDGAVDEAISEGRSALEPELEIAALPDSTGGSGEPIERLPGSVEAVDDAAETIAALPVAPSEDAADDAVIADEVISDDGLRDDGGGISEALEDLSEGVAAVGDVVGKAAGVAATVVTETARELASTAREGLADLVGSDSDGVPEGGEGRLLAEVEQVTDAEEARQPLVIAPPNPTPDQQIAAVPAEIPVDELVSGSVDGPVDVSDVSVLPTPGDASVAPSEPAATSSVATDSLAEPAVVQPQVVARVQVPSLDVDEQDNGDPPVVPTFDVVRVDRNGGVVIAGRSAPFCIVEVQDGNRVVGSARANPRGEWVIVPDAPLAPGSRELGLRAVCGADDEALSDRLIVVVVPERGEDIAGQASDADGGALALSVPRSGGGQTRILQAPAVPDVEAQDTEVTAGDQADAAAIGLTALSLDVVDYGDGGDLELAGRAEAGAALRLYLDNQPIGDTAAGLDSRWTLVPEQPVEPGLYTLRVDQMARDGSVTARVELPFLRGEPLQDLPDGRIVIVQPGNSLWRIARRTYGEGVQFTLIFGANADQIRDPDLIYPGQIFTLPVVN